jgi:hypothetical protein
MALPSRFRSFEHDLFGKPLSTFPDHAWSADLSATSCRGSGAAFAERRQVRYIG